MRPRPTLYSVKLARRICARLAAGLSVARLSRDPGMPAACTIRDWIATRPEFARLYRAACDRRAGIAARNGTRDAGKAGRPTLYTPELARKICGLVAGGLSLRAIAARPGMPNLATLHNWKLEHPDFKGMYLAAWEDFAQMVADETIEIADQAWA